MVGFPHPFIVCEIKIVVSTGSGSDRVTTSVSTGSGSDWVTTSVSTGSGSDRVRTVESENAYGRSARYDRVQGSGSDD